MSHWAPEPTLRRKVAWQARHVWLPIYLRLLAAWNRTSRRRVTSDRGTVDVSLTTFGPRTNYVWLTIETIGLGSVRPRRLILWLDDESVVAAPPARLRRLQKRGLELRGTDDYRSYKKFYPYSVELGHERRPLVTADDDVLYPRWWLRGLVGAHRAHPSNVNAYRVHEKTYGTAGPAPYREWKPCLSTAESEDHFATGVSGVIYGPEMVEMLARHGDAFRSVAPTADDVWLHFAMLTAGWTTRQVRTTPAVFPEIPGTRANGLHLVNDVGGENDEQIAATSEHFADLLLERQYEG